MFAGWKRHPDRRRQATRQKEREAGGLPAVAIAGPKAQALVSMMLPIFLRPAEMSSPTVAAADFTVSTVVS